MAGFENQVLVCDNVNFNPALAKPHLGSITTNGQLIIGSTALNAGGTHLNIGNITSTGGTISVTNGAGTINLEGFGTANDLHVARWIVNATPGQGGNQTSITAALASAISGQTIFIMPGTYTENITLKAGVNLTAFNCDAINRLDSSSPNVIIKGTCTASFSGTCSISGICLQTNSAPCLTVSGANATNVNLSQCLINATNNNAILLSSTGGSNINLFQCNGNLGTTGIHFFDITGTSATMFIFDGYYSNGGFSLDPCIVSGAGSVITMRYVTFLNAITTSSTSAVNFFSSNFLPGNATVTINGTGGTNYAWYSRFESTLGSTALIVGPGVTLNTDYLDIDSSATNAIDGTGIIKYGNISFTGISSKNNVTTKTPLGFQAVTTAISQLVYSSTNNDLAGLTSANSAQLVSTSAGVPVWSSTMTNGQMIIGSTGATPTSGTITSTGGTITVSTGAGTLNLEVASGGLAWVDATNATQAISVETGYVTDRGAGVTYTLPASATLGQVIRIVGKLGIAVITPNANQQILIGSTSGSVGVTGTATANNVGDCIELICITAGASTVYRASSVIGTWTLA